MPGTLYLIHIDPPFKHAGHYLGYTDRSAQERFAEHLAGIASPLIRAAIAAGHDVRLVKEWEGDRTEERRLKNMGGHGPRLCALCREAFLARRKARERTHDRVLEDDGLSLGG